MQPYANVVFNLPLDQVYTYSVPDDLREHLMPGVRVAVHLRKHLATGYVVGMSPEAPYKDIKPICDVLDSEPLFDERLLRLTRWISDPDQEIGGEPGSASSLASPFLEDFGGDPFP